MLKYNKTIMYNLYTEYTNATTRKDKSIVIQKIRDVLTKDDKSVSKVTIYNILNKFKTQNQPKPKRRKNEDSILRDLEKIAKMKQGMSVGKKGSPLSTERAVLALTKSEQLENKLSTAQWDRLLKQYHLSNKHFNNVQSVVTKLVADHANEFCFADATPIPQYFLNLKDNSIKYRSDILMNDKHLEDVLSKYRLRKVWLYVIRDLFSGAYMCMLDIPAGDRGGENALAWIKAFQYWMSPKRDNRIPVLGVPRVIMSDAGSGLTSHAFKDFFSPLGTDLRTHKVGNPAAKGFVEGQIRAIQQNIFKFIRNRNITDFTDLVKFIDEHVIYDNHIKGYYKKYYQSLATTPPIVVKTDISEVVMKTTTRILSSRRAIRLDGKLYILIGANSADLQEGIEIKIFKKADNTFYALDPDGYRYALREGVITRNARTMQILNNLSEETHKTDTQKKRETIKKESADYVDSFDRDTFLPPSTAYPEYHFETSDIRQPSLPHEEYKVNQYLDAVLKLADLRQEDIEEETIQKIKSIFLEAVQADEEIPTDLLKNLANSLLENL